MIQFFRRLLKFVLYAAAGVLIALAIAVGLFRLFLPRLPEYQAEIKNWASEAIGMQVEFSGMNARWGLSGPELAFYNAELNRPDSSSSLVAAEEVRVGVALMRLLGEGALVVDRVVVRDTNIEVEQREDGSWVVQGSTTDGLFGKRAGAADLRADIEIVLEDIGIALVQPGEGDPRLFSVPRAVVSIDDKRIALDGTLRLPADLGRQLRLSATRVLTLPAPQQHWDLQVEADDVQLAGWMALLPENTPQLRTGTGDIDVAIDYANGRVRNAGASVALADVTLADGETFGVDGRFELNLATDGWLVAAEELRVSTAGGNWPESSLRVEAGTDADDRIVMVDVRASFFDLGAVSLIAPWLPEAQRQQLAAFDPNGTVTDLAATVSDLHKDSPSYDIAAELADVGFAAGDDRPGIRGFSGLLRANRRGGRLEMRSRELTVELPGYVPEPIPIEYADGTVIWRTSDLQTTVLSDSIRIGNDVFRSQSNVQLTLYDDDASPVIDLASTWSVSDISAVAKYIPQKMVKPKLYDWFQSALVAGSIPVGKTTLTGPLDKFPFDGGDGRFLIESSVRNLTFKFQPRWPAATQADMQIVLDGTRLYSERNQFFIEGNRSVDAMVEIGDLREPVLRIEALSTGTLETIRKFSMQSPIDDILGGQLDRISVSGDASFDLDLTVPLKDSKLFDFTTVIRSNDGTLAIDGFAPPITDLIGAVTISRDEISSEALGATFLGHPVSIELGRSEEPGFSVVAAVDGYVSESGIINELGVPLDGVVSGGADYQAQILFPRGKQQPPSALTIRIESDLEGFAVDLPEPAGKPRDSTLQIQGDLRFLPGGGVIESAGFTENQIAWQVAFARGDDGLDFDRGVVTLGRHAMQPAETRGLHIRGSTDTVRFEDWLALSRSGARKTGAADRIRSIDLTIADFYAIGQHLEGHNVRVDRSANDWLVQLDGEDIAGSLFVPYDFASGREMVLDMERLHLPGDETASGEPAAIDPRGLPPIAVTAGDFALGDRNFGALEATVERVPGGLQATMLTSKDDSFEIDATGTWITDESEPLGSRTSVSGALTSRDVMRTMRRLDFDPGIRSDSMNVQFDVSWSGGPRASFLDVLDGDVQVRFGAGQLEEVEPGAGRVFGLMSIVALPRRLSLDFSDVFDRGFGFDKIAGRFRIDDGDTYTCDLSLAGPAADIGIVGRAGLASRDYEQAAVVSANFGNTLPIVGAVVAGPQVAAALLIFSQIFKKPLQEVSQVYYTIGGTWDEPVVESSGATAFANRGLMAGCIAEGASPAGNLQGDAR